MNTCRGAVGILLGFLLVAGTAAARDIYLKTRGTSSQTWLSDQSWVNGTIPNDPGDVVHLTIEGSSNPLLMQLATQDVAIDSLIDGTKPSSEFRYNNGGSAPARLSVRQMSGYLNYLPFGWYRNDAWKSGRECSGLDFRGTAAEPTIVHSAFICNLTSFGVPEANGKAEIERLYGGGSFRKDGPGELVVNCPLGLETGCALDEGPLTLAAMSETRTDVPAAGAFFRMDASETSTVLTDDGGNVTNWLDAAGSDFRALPCTLVMKDSGTAAPTVMVWPANGRQVISFGSFARYEDGQSEIAPAAAMEWSQSSTELREVFLAVAMYARKPGAGTAAPMVGVIGSDSTHFLMDVALNSCMIWSYMPDAVATGDVRVNGTPVSCDMAGDPLELRIVSIKTTAGCDGKYFGRERTTGRGGFYLGEAIVYTNELTEAARRQTIAYLKNKWLKVAESSEKQEWDLGYITATGTASIAVKAADTVRVKTISARGEAGLVKSGAGTLSVETIEPANAPVTVAGGTIKFANRLGAAPTDALPENPVWHFDAADEESFEYYDDGSVRAWHDTRADSTVVATNLFYNGVELPRVERVAGVSPTELAAVDCGVIGPGNSNKDQQRRMGFSGPQVYDALVVWKNQSNHVNRNPVPFGSYTTTGWSRPQVDSVHRLLPDNTAPIRFGARWTLNGVPFKPMGSIFHDMGGDDGWVVIHFHGRLPVTIDGIAASKNDWGGGCQVGELIGYDRPLTDAESRAAEAYLMKRWLGKTHPENEAWKGSLAFESGVVARVDTDRDLEPASVTSGSASFVKAGTGSLKLAALGANVTSLAVEGGTLALGDAATLPADVTLTAASLDQPACLSVSGELSLPAAATVRVTVSPDEFERESCIPLVTAGSFVNPEAIAGWTLENISGVRHVRLVVRGSTVCLYRETPGLMILMR